MTSKSSTALPIIISNFQKIPELKIIDEEITRKVNNPITDLLSPFEALSNNNLIKQLVVNEIKNFNCHQGVFHEADESEVYLFADNSFTISLRALGVVNQRQKSMIAGVSVDLFISNPTQRTISIPVYFERTANGLPYLEKIESVNIKPTHILKCTYGSGIIPDLDSLDTGCVLCLRSINHSKDIWVYNRSTLKGEYKAAVSSNDSRCVTACRLIADIPTNESSKTLQYIAKNHPAHFVRWEALKNLGRIDRKKAISLLESACNDPHPQVAKAASKTLSKIRIQK